jgi:hypothetical protein
MRPFILAAAASLALGQSLGAQESAPPRDDLQNFASLTSYVMSIPSGDMRGFITTPSWFGLSWEGIWAVRHNTAAGIAFSVHDFNHSSFGTTDYEWGASTGQHTRTLLVTSAMATGRWYPMAPRTLRPHLGLAAGVVYSQESYRLGISQVDRSATHLAIAPETGWEFPMAWGVDGLVSLRYTIPTNTGNYVGGSKSYPFATVSFGILER